MPVMRIEVSGGPAEEHWWPRGNHRVVEQVPDRASEQFWPARRREQSGLASNDDDRNCIDGGGDDRQPGNHCLDDSAWQSFVAAGHGKDVEPR